jgi:hypothetical protein
LENVTLFPDGTYFVTVTAGGQYPITLFDMGICGQLDESTIGGPIFPNQTQVLHGSSNMTLQEGDTCEAMVSPQRQGISIGGETFTVKAVNAQTEPTRSNSFELQAGTAVASPDGAGNATMTIRNTGNDGVVGFDVEEFDSQPPGPLVFLYEGSPVGPSNPLPPGGTAVLDASLGDAYYSAPQQPHFYLAVSLYYADGCTGLLALEFSQA